MIKTSHYSFVGDRQKLRDIGWKFHRHEGLSYSYEYMLYMRAAGGMEICISQASAYFHSDIIDFILENKDKDKSFWFDNDYKGFSNEKWIMRKNSHKIISLEENLKFGEKEAIEKLVHHKDKRSKNYKEFINDFKYLFSENQIDFKISFELVEAIIALNNIHPLKKVSYNN